MCQEKSWNAAFKTSAVWVNEVNEFAGFSGMKWFFSIFTAAVIFLSSISFDQAKEIDSGLRGETPNFKDIEAKNSW